MKDVRESVGTPNCASKEVRGGWLLPDDTIRVVSCTNRDGGLERGWFATNRCEGRWRRVIEPSRQGGSCRN